MNNCKVCNKQCDLKEVRRIYGEVPAIHGCCSAQCYTTKLMAKIAPKESTLESLRNFAINIKPVLLRMKNDENMEFSDRQTFTSFYVEVFKTMENMYNFAMNTKDLVLKLNEGENLNADERNRLIQFYVEAVNTMA